MTRVVACPRCASTTELVAYMRGVSVWDGNGWVSTGEHDLKWISCSGCGHTWRTKRALADLEAL